MTPQFGHRVQTAFRLDPVLLERLKRQAEANHQSLNAYVELILIKASEPVLPKIPKNYQVSEEIKDLFGCVKLKEPTQEELKNDPKLDYLWNKYLR